MIFFSRLLNPATWKNQPLFLALTLMAVVQLDIRPVQAEGLEIAGFEGKPLVVELVWESPVDLDLFLTDPAGETVYFANRIAKNGTKMGLESGCEKVGGEPQSYLETVKIPVAQLGRYRVSVDFIKGCGNSFLEAEFDIILKNGQGTKIDQTRSAVQYRLLNPVAWEFIIK